MKLRKVKRDRSNYTEIINYLDYKGFSPSQIRHICVKYLKMNPDKVRRKVSHYVSRDWIRKAEVRFFKEKIVNELRRLGLYE